WKKQQPRNSFASPPLPLSPRPAAAPVFLCSASVHSTRFALSLSRPPKLGAGTSPLRRHVCRWHRALRAGRQVNSMQPMAVVPPVESQASMSVADGQICRVADPAVPNSGDFQLD
uniref:Uncharacterized protein n=1 Tax=Triticum urartu TaxID=4572 RepID=A0A8R7PYR2_TRIUA